MMYSLCKLDVLRECMINRFNAPQLAAFLRSFAVPSPSISSTRVTASRLAALAPGNKSTSLAPAFPSSRLLSTPTTVLGNHSDHEYVVEGRVEDRIQQIALWFLSF